MAVTVLIAASKQLPALQQHADLADAEAFEDTDALKALDAIARRPPEVIALERQFASSARGGAFINRIKADPALASCEIRIIELGNMSAPVPTPAAPADAPPVQPATPNAKAAQPTAAEFTPASGTRDQTRGAERHTVGRNVEILIDGNPATLINISVVGAQVLSPSSLRPNQRVRMSLVDATRPMRFNGVVAWATFEMPKEGPRYRAGVKFHDAAPDMVERFIESIMAS